VKVVAIYVAPASRLPMRALDSIAAEAGKVLVGTIGVGDDVALQSERIDA
jgi:hypothetical protein